MTITTLIPAYKPEYLDELLTALVSQTYSDFKVIISDDSPDQVVSRVIRSKQLSYLTQKLNIELITGPQKGGFSNTFFLVREFAKQREFFHILLDDDVIYPTFYETHIRHHQQKHALVSCSSRWVSNQNGQPTSQPMDFQTSSVFRKSFNSSTIGQHLVSVGSNKLGEWSHALYRQEAGEIILNPYIDDVCYFGLDDIGSFIHATIENEGIWIPESLGFFRMHANQNSQNVQNDTIKCSHYAWIALAIISLEKGWITQFQAMQCVKKISAKVKARFGQDALGIQMLDVMENHIEINTVFKQSFLAIWNKYLQEIELDKILAGDLSIKLL